MKKLIPAFFAMALLPMNSCKDNAAEKVNQANVEMAAERDAQKIVFPTIKFEKVNILVNANRTIIPSNPLDDKGGALEKSISQNLIATLNVSQLFAKSVIKQTKNRKNSEIVGSIINLTSIAANQTIPDMMPYSVSCAALNQLTRSLAVSLAKNGIRVNAISLGSIMSSSLRLNLHSNPELQDSIIDATPLGYIAEPEEVAELALFLSSEGASFLTGQVITIEGGRSILNKLEKAAY